MSAINEPKFQLAWLKYKSIYDPNKTILYSDNKSEITYESADANGWYHVTVDCSGVASIAGGTVKYIRFSVDPADKNDNKVIEPVIWIDELIIY